MSKTDIPPNVVENHLFWDQKRGTKNDAGMGFCTVHTAGFFWYMLVAKVEAKEAGDDQKGC